MRYLALWLSVVGIVVFALLMLWDPAFFALPLAICIVLSVIGIRDMTQTRHSIKRNYPILANIRFMLEEIRPEIRQYFLESDTDGTPFNRSKRAVAYQRAKGPKNLVTIPEITHYGVYMLPAARQRARHCGSGTASRPN